MRWRRWQLLAVRFETSERTPFQMREEITQCACTEWLQYAQDSGHACSKVICEQFVIRVSDKHQEISSSRKRVLLGARILTHSPLGHAFKTQDADADSAPGRARGRDCSLDFSRTESRGTDRRRARRVACNRFRWRFHGHSSNPMKSAGNNVPYFVKLALTAYSVQVWTWRLVGEIALSLCPGSYSVPCFGKHRHARSGWTRRRWKRAAGVDRRRSWAKWKHLGYGCVELGRALRMGADGCRGTGPFAWPI